MMSSESPSRCRVCNDVNAANHYGSICCSGCKAFFRRTIRYNRKYLCFHNNVCPVNAEYRNGCRACRYARCLSVGLDPLLVHSDRGALQRKNKPKTEAAVVAEIDHENTKYTTLPEIAPTKCNNLVSRNYYRQFNLDSEYDHWFQLATNAGKRLGECNSLSLGKLRIIPEFDKNSVGSVAKYYVLVDRLCDAYFDCDVHTFLSSNKEYKHSLDVPVMCAFNEPRAISARTRVDWQGKFHITAPMMKRMWCRTVSLYVDWSSHIPELDELDEQDRIILIADRTVACVNFMTAHKAVQYKTKGIPLSGGSYFPFDPEEQKLIDPSIRSYLAQLFNWLYSEFVIPATKLGLSEVEYVLLKNVVFFSASDHLSPKGKEIVHRARRFYRNVLCKAIQDQFPDYSTDKILDQIAAIMDLLPKIEQTRALGDANFSIMTLFNIGELQGSLSYDVHIKKGSELYALK